MSDFATEFLKGQKDFKEGLPRKRSKPGPYQRGYTTQRDLEAVTKAVKENRK